MVHFNITVIVLLHKHFNSWLRTWFNSISIIMNCVYAMSKSNIMVCVCVCVCQQFVHLFWLIMSSFPSVLIIFDKFFTWISLGDIDFCFSPMLVKTANAFEEESKWVSWLHHQCSNHFIHVTDGVTVISLLASLLQKINEPMHHLCQVTSNKKIFTKVWKVMHIFKLR
jgi:hypothetical protein